VRPVFRASALCVAIAIVSACDAPQAVFETVTPPTAGVRFINAVPDTQALDFRFVDIPENSAHWAVAFRNNPITTSCVTGSNLIQYKPARAGERQFRIFLNDTLQDAASQVIKDTTVTLEAGKQYTALLWGYARTGATPAMRLTFMEDNPPDPGAQVAVRVINASGTAYDVSQYVPSNSANNVPATATWSNVGPLSMTDYVMVAPGSIRFHTRAAGGATLVADALALRGEAPAAAGFDPMPGTTVAGSAITAIIFPLSVSGSEGAQTAPHRPSTGSQPATRVTATAGGYARSSGSFVSDCFFVGGTVTASGFTIAANNGTSVITAMTATTLTVSKTVPPVPEGADPDSDPTTATPNRTITGATPSAFTSFMWDRRPPRP
jgi:hypothetical protein